MNLLLELEVLESFNTIRQVPLVDSDDPAYLLTALGRHAVGFVAAANL